MLDVLIKVLGAIVGFYALKGMLGKGRDGDWTKLVLALAACLVLFAFKNRLV